MTDSSQNTEPTSTWHAHSCPSKEPQHWEPLSAHLHRVAQGGEYGPGAAQMASAFGAEEWGALLGRWHDLGKYSAEFQNYLLRANGIESANAHIERRGRVDHSTFGAQHADRTIKGGIGQLIAYCIAGHHAGLANFDGDSGLDARLQKTIPSASPPSDLLEPPALAFPAHFRIAASRSAKAFQFAFFTRMIFSCLVDADFLATEWWMRSGDTGHRTTARVSMAELSARLDAHLLTLQRNAGSACASHVTTARNEVLTACRKKATRPPGVFTLTVPTGGGKTFSSMAFALRHADKHAMRRVIYAIPYTSIIEQNADEFRKAFGDLAERAILEHHSNFESRKHDEDGNPVEDHWSRLAAENWDAPVVITTTVQLYESLFHNRTSRCRKLHNIARSVIVLDEAQSIPVPLLKPTLAALQELVRNYGCSIVLCTATQPAVLRRDDFPIGLEAPDEHEIVPDVPKLFASLKRTAFEGPIDLTDELLANELVAHPQALCIVRTKMEARSVFQQLQNVLNESRDTPEDARSCFHLSTDMCPAHRKEVLDTIRARLNAGTPCRVVSTPLIEAGVDVSFTTVYRAMAGLDSLAQAAGRCNRNGESATPGRVVIYNNLDHPVPDAMHEVRRGIEDTRTTMQQFDDLLSPDAVKAYFCEHYWRRTDEWDHHHVLACFNDFRELSFNFRSAAERYRLITDDQVSVVVPWKEKGRALVEQLQSLAFPAGRELRRRCQRYAVGVRPYALTDLMSRGIVAEPPGDLARGLYFLNDPTGEVYDAQLGLDPTAAPGPEGLIQ